MLSYARSRVFMSACRSSRFITRANYSVTSPRLSEVPDHTVPTHEQNPQKPSPVSETNATPVSSMGAWDSSLQEAPEQARRDLENQAPNRSATWARSQQSREKAMTGPRFEQTMMEYQVRYCLDLERYMGMDNSLTHTLYPATTLRSH